MPVLTQGFLTGEYLVSEAPGSRSRDVATVTVAGGVALPPGTVLGKVTASGKLVKYSDGASDGSQAAVAILYEGCPATNGDYKRTVHNTDCEVIAAALNGGAGVDANGRADLLALGIKLR